MEKEVKLRGGNFSTCLLMNPAFWVMFYLKRVQKKNVAKKIQVKWAERSSEMFL